jgi:type I restriction enzyme R subunit
MFETKFSTKDSLTYYNYYNDISKKVKERKIDILLVVNMFLTGFDSKPLNTLYVDKNLIHHGLIQAYSRTNRILNEQKSQGNIIVFRNLKKATDEAITLFSNKDAIDEIIMQPYEDYITTFNEKFEELIEVVPTIDSVNELSNEEEELAFIKAFRALMRVKNIMTTFSDFKWEDLEMTEQLFEDYKSKYLDLYDKVKDNHGKEKVSILEDVDFELELIHRDEINVSYILKLLAELKGATKGEKEKRQKEIIDLLTGESNLRSKRELIERFILENLPAIDDSETIPQEFDKFWGAEQQKAFNTLVAEEKLSPDKTQKLIENYLFAEREPLLPDILELIEGEQPKMLQRKKIGAQILNKVIDFVETFINGIVGE